MKPIVDKNFEENHSDRTSLIKDRIIPNVKTSMSGAVGAAGGAVLGAGLGLATRKVSRGAMKKVLNSEANKKVLKSLSGELAKNPELYTKIKRAQKPVNMFFGPEMAKTRGVMAAGAGALAMAPKGRDIAKVTSNVSDLKKQYVAQFGVEPTESEMMEVAKLNPKNRTHRALSNLFYTPNAMTKSNFREMRQMYNVPNSLGKDPKELGNMVMPSRAHYPHVSNFNYYGYDTPSSATSTGLNKRAYSYVDTIEKIAIDAQSIAKANETIRKVAPVAGAALGSAVAFPAAKMFTNHLTADDAKGRKLKRALGTAAGTSLGGLTGGVLLKDVADAATSVSDKVILYPKKTLVDGVKNYAKIFKRSDYYESEIEKMALSLAGIKPIMGVAKNLAKPLAKPAAVGAGVGALGGGIRTAYQNSKVSDPSQKRSVLGGAAKGALGGAATAGVYTAGKSILGAMKKPKPIGLPNQSTMYLN